MWPCWSATLTGNAPGMRLRATLSDADGQMASGECAADLDLAPGLDLHIPEGRRRLWKAGAPHLYDVAITVVDEATSYTALRAVSTDGQAINLNGEVVFQRLVLDQGIHNSYASEW